MSSLFALILTFLFTKSTFSHACDTNLCCNIDFRQVINLIVAKTTNDCSNDPPNTMAVMLYDESKVLPVYKHEREFQFADRRVVIPQRWNEHGVSAVVWDAAIVLCEYMERHPHLVEGKRVLELGAGTGMVGIVAAYLGGRVTITERQIALDHLKTVVTKNTDKNQDVTIQELDWTTADQFPDQSFDVILGADIIYIEDVFNDLLKTLAKFSGTETVVYLSCKIRYERDTRFIQMFGETFSVKELHYDQSRDIRIYIATVK